MRLASPWHPRLADVPGLAHERLVAALAEDIVSGALGPGARLPPHRDLAHALDLGIGTVTKAYATLQRRGLARSEKGRGMFVAFSVPQGPRRLNLSVNLPPPVLTGQMLTDMLARIGETIDPDIFTRYTGPAGLPEHRTMLARKISEGRELAVEPGQLLLTNGAQHAVFLAMAAAPAGPLAIERLSYPGALRAARRLGRRLVALDMDDQGILPASLEAALERPDPPRVLYLVPSLQNPTGALMGEERRSAIAALARRADLTVIEDDVYSVFAPKGLPPLARLAPERVLYVGSLAKSLAPGFRVGYLVAPLEMLEACNGWLHATQSMAPPLSGLLMAHALTEGLTKSVAQSIRLEATRRNRVARAILADALAPMQMDALHVWLPMPTARARDIVLAAAQLNLTLAPPEAFMAEPGDEQSGLRLCLGHVGEGELQPALETIARLLRQGADAQLDTLALV